MKIEIQVRTSLQHAWATAVETVAAFSGQALKSRGGDEDWRRFFALMSSAVALRERRPLVPGTPTDKKDLLQELQFLSSKLNVEKVLEAWRVSVQEFTERVDKNTFAILLHFDPERRSIRFKSYSLAEMPQASEDYIRAEKNLEVSLADGAQSVLVSVSSLHALRRAYPNYYLDTTAFVEAMRYALRPLSQRAIRFSDRSRQGNLFSNPPVDSN